LSEPCALGKEPWCSCRNCELIFGFAQFFFQKKKDQKCKIDFFISEINLSVCMSCASSRTRPVQPHKNQLETKKSLYLKTDHRHTSDLALCSVWLSFSGILYSQKWRAASVYAQAEMSWAFVGFFRPSLREGYGSERTWLSRPFIM